ncbi:MAG TPA: ATP-binding protein [Candidatus Binatia bacterium]|nr:ATP-binding protein [Candidatus Binatia bacterium]
MKVRWQRRSLSVRLALWNAVAAAAAALMGLALAAALGIWKPANFPTLLAELALIWAFPISICSIGAYFIARRMLAPLGELVTRTRRFSAKALSQRLPVANPDDELGQLAAGLNDLLEQLESSFAELDRLTADVSHELRTPLTAMRAVGEVALRERNPAVLHDAVGSMLEEIRRMNQLIDRLLLLTRSDNAEIPLQMEAGLVRPVLVEVNDALSLVAEEKQQQLQADCPDHLLAVFDPALLRLALMNLTQNAIRYSPPGKPIKLRAFSAQDSLIVEVADEGPGIAPEHQQKIFERFYRVDKARSRADGGVGLGLAIVKWAVERMGGAVGLDSEPGRGSVFRIHLRTILHRPEPPGFAVILW